jgi:hypothetical protein
MSGTWNISRFLAFFFLIIILILNSFLILVLLLIYRHLKQQIDLGNSVSTCNPTVSQKEGNFELSMCFNKPHL